MTLEDDHAQVAFSLLALNGNLQPPNGHVFDGKVDDGTIPPYVLIYSRVQWPRDGVGTALDALQDTITTTWICHCVGSTATAARVVAGQVRASLLNARPVLAGRNCGPIKQSEAQDPIRDESLGTLVMDAVSVYDFSSTG